MSITNITPLRADEWEYTRTRAESLIRARLVRPERQQFLARDSKYPPALAAAGVILLIIVALAAFVISAGKQVAAADVITARLATDYAARISSGYVDAVLVAMLTLSEFGVILFGFGSRVLATSRVSALLLRVFQAVSVAVAIGGNLTIFALSFSPVAWPFDLLITIAAPVIVIGIGLMIEQLAYDAVTRRQEALNAFRTAEAEFEAISAAPQQHPDWFTVWGEIILETLRAHDANREIIDTLLADNPRLRQAIVGREWKRHDWHFDPDEYERELKREIEKSQSPTSLSAPTSQEIPTSTKLRFCIDAYAARPELKTWSGRDLEEGIPGPDGKPISYRTWNDAKTFSPNGHVPETEMNP